MTFLRLGAAILALSTTLKLYCVAKMLREKAGVSGCVECNAWSAEPMAFAYTIYFLSCIIWYCAVDIPKTYEHLNYQNMAMVPTLEVSTGFDEALNRRSFTRVDSVWTPFVLWSYFASLAVGSTLSVFMAAAPRLALYKKTNELSDLIFDYTHH